ncbi:MAG: hypothetical protein AAB400_05450 [Patescibacteria group bacterium]
MKLAKKLVLGITCGVFVVGMFSFWNFFTYAASEYQYVFIRMAYSSNVNQCSCDTSTATNDCPSITFAANADSPSKCSDQQTTRGKPYYRIYEKKEKIPGQSVQSVVPQRQTAGHFCIGNLCVSNWGSLLTSSVAGGRYCINGNNNCIQKGQFVCASKGGDNDNDGICNNDDECENHSGTSQYSGCPEEAPTIYNERYDPSDKKLKWGVRGDEATMYLSGSAGYVQFEGGYHRPRNQNWEFNRDVSACGGHQINLSALPSGKRKTGSFSKTVNVQDTNVCPPAVAPVVGSWTGCSGCAPRNESASCTDGQNGGESCSQLATRNNWYYEGGRVTRSCTNLPACIAVKGEKKCYVGRNACSSDKCGGRDLLYECVVDTGSSWSGINYCTDNITYKDLYTCTTLPNLTGGGLPITTLPPGGGLNDPCLTNPTLPSCIPIMPGPGSCLVNCTSDRY